MESDLKKINNFIDLVERIKKLAFVSEFQKNNLSNLFQDKSDPERPNEELLRSFILDIRKLYMESEYTSFKKMIPIFLKYLEFKEIADLQKLQNEYEENLTIKFPSGFPAIESKSIKDILDDWFYGYYIHEDESKKETIDNLGKGRDFYKWIFIDNIGSFIFYYSFSLEEFAKKILKIQESS